MLYSTRPTIVKLTKAQYDALDPADKTNDTIYFITDVNGDGQSFQPVIYSTEEREIGVWTDGKPLYEKTFKVDNISIDTSHETEIADLTTLNVETWVGVVNSVGYLHAYDITVNENRLSIGYKPTSKKLVAGQSYTQQYTTVDIITTIRYTKTTDTPGSGAWTPQGVPAVHYSTEEQIVGTWIDGKTLYQKTLVFQAPSTRDYTQHSLGVSVDYATVYESAIIKGGQIGIFNGDYDGSPANDEWQGFINKSNSSFDYRVGANYLNADCYVTLRYTKPSI